MKYYLLYISFSLIALIVHVNTSIARHDVHSQVNFEKENIRIKKSIYNVTQVKWTNKIRYHASASQDKVDNAIKNIESNTCIRFEKQNNKITNGYGINFVWASSCDFQFYGRNPNVTPLPQVINISSDCDGVIGIQELIHNTLLVKNEHTRSDRNKYIKVIATLADPKDMYRFNIDNASDTTFFGMAYDYGSMTHFSSTQYADTGKEIITATKYHEHYKRTMGQRVMVTFNDYKLLNYYYCNNTCTSRKTNCQNDGYQDPNNCDKCKCPSGYVGNECQNIAPSENECGSWTYDAQPYKQNLRVCGRINCYIRIISQRFKNIKLILKDMFVFSSYNADYYKCVEGNGLDIKYRASKGPMGICFCRAIVENPIVIKSESHIVLLHYVGNYFLHFIDIDYKEI